MAQVLVLGATGAIGAHVVRALLEAGWSVRALARASSDAGGLEGLDVELVTGDVRRAESVAAALRGCGALVHAAGWYPTGPTTPERAIRAGLASVAPALEAARETGVRRVVYVSSAGTLGRGRRASPRPGRRAPADRRVPLADEEDAASNPGRGPYTAAKLAMERAALAAAAAGLPLVVVNPTLCLGEHDRKPTSGRVLFGALTSRLPVVPDAPLNVVWTGDVARGVAAALERGRVGERYVLGGANTTLAWLLRQAAFAAGRVPAARRWAVPASAARVLTEPLLAAAALDRRPGGAGSIAVALELLAAAQHVDRGKAAQELGLPEPLPAVETVRRSVAWLVATFGVDGQTAR